MQERKRGHTLDPENSAVWIHVAVTTQVPRPTGMNLPQLCHQLIPFRLFVYKLDQNSNFFPSLFLVPLSGNRSWGLAIVLIFFFFLQVCVSEREIDRQTDREKEREREETDPVQVEVVKVGRTVTLPGSETWPQFS